MDSTIACSGLRKSYGKVVLRGIDLTIGAGICAVLGRNGAGKSTLLRILAGMERADAGEVRIGGMRFETESIAIKRRMGCVPEGLGLFEPLTVMENVQAVGPVYGLNGERDGAACG